MTATLAEQIKAEAIALGFDKVGIASVDPPDTAALAALDRWLAQGYQAEMGWMASDRRRDVRNLLPNAQSVICVALNYYTGDHPESTPDVGKIARYAWGRDYHRVLEKRLKALARWLQTQQPGCECRWYVDSGPIADKVWAQRAGLGWIAKNSNVISREFGSWIFLGELVTDLALPADRPHTAHCGTCSRCLDACPTQAIVEPYVVDANRCIAYHTIENRAAELPEAIAQNLHGWVAGCDICQEVCPWNQRFAQKTSLPDLQPRSEQLAPELAALATLSEEEWDRQFQGSALRRIKPAMWRRNSRANLAQQSQRNPLS